MSRASALLRSARQEAGLTQAELARRAGTTQSVIARMESPSSNPTVATLDDVFAAMNRSLAVGPSPATPDIDEGQVREQLRLTPAQRLAKFEASHRSLHAMLGRAQRVTG